MLRFKFVATLTLICLVDRAIASGQCFKATPQIDVDLKRVSFGNILQLHDNYIIKLNCVAILVGRLLVFNGK